MNGNTFLSATEKIRAVTKENSELRLNHTGRGQAVSNVFFRCAIVKRIAKVHVCLLKRCEVFSKI